MSREGDQPDNSPPRSLVDPTEFRSNVGSPRARSALLLSPGRGTNDLPLIGSPKGPANYVPVNNGNDYDDVESNVQEGMRSEAGETILPVVSISFFFPFVG